MNFKNVLNTFRLVAFTEGCTYLLFAVSMPLKYYFNTPEPNYFIGMAHGFLFMFYVLLLVVVAYKHKCSFFKVMISFIVAFIPFGTFWADKNWYLQKK